MIGVVFGNLVSLGRSVKRKQALRERNLSRDSRADGAPTVHPTSGERALPEVFSFMPFGHQSHASENSAAQPHLAEVIFLVCSRQFALLRSWFFASGRMGGIGLTVLCRGSVTTWRLNSSLRSHRIRRSPCRRVFSGLNKTLFASVGPNSHCRDHRQANRATPRPLPKKRCSLLGRINACRGHRSDGTSSQGRDVTKIPPRQFDLGCGFGGLLSCFAFASRGVGRFGALFLAAGTVVRCSVEVFATDSACNAVSSRLLTRLRKQFG